MGNTRKKREDVAVSMTADGTVSTVATDRIALEYNRDAVHQKAVVSDGKHQLQVYPDGHLYFGRSPKNGMNDPIFNKVQPELCTAITDAACAVAMGQLTVKEQQKLEKAFRKFSARAKDEHFTPDEVQRSIRDFRKVEAEGVREL